MDRCDYCEFCNTWGCNDEWNVMDICYHQDVKNVVNAIKNGKIISEDMENNNDINT